jgi:hypothetical protein
MFDRHILIILFLCTNAKLKEHIPVRKRNESFQQEKNKARTEISSSFAVLSCLITI